MDSQNAKTETNGEETSLESRMLEIEVMKQRSKLVLWRTRYCKPILTHRELLPIMENLGFVASVSREITAFDGFKFYWIVYKYCGTSGSKVDPLRSSQPSLTTKTPPTPKLPVRYIDGLHLYTYRAFLEAVDFYLGLAADNVFHIQGIPANLQDTELRRWTYAQECGTLVRLGTLDPDLLHIYSNDSVAYMNLQIFPAKKEVPVDPDSEIIMVAIDDILVKAVTNHQDNNNSKKSEMAKAKDFGEYKIQ